MALLAFVFTVTWFVSTGMAVHLPCLLQIAGLPSAGAKADPVTDKAAVGQIT